jgi:glycosyltransferase involved in cell wall biosynthesis
MNLKTPYIKVANIIEEGKLGGPQVRIVMVASEIKDLVDTTVIMPIENSKIFRQRCKENNVNYKTMSISRITKEWRIALRYLAFFPIEIIKISLYLRKEKFDLVHISGGSWQYKGLIAAKIMKKKVLWHLNDTSQPLFFRIIFSLFSGWPDGYIYASERSRDYYKNLIRHNNREFVIPAPVDTVKFNHELILDGPDGDLIKMWEGKIVIGTIANINPIKGMETIIRTAALLDNQVDNIQFIVIGEIFRNQKRYYEKLKKLCSKLSVHNISFLGPRKDVRELLQRIDIYLCSSVAESSPIAVWEAMSMKKPIVSTNVGDTPLYVVNGLNGYISDVGDYFEISNHLSKLANDKVLRNEFGVESRLIATSKLDIKYCSNKHVSAYRKILGIDC